MNTAAVRANRRKLLILAAIVLLCATGYMLVEVNFSNPKLLAYAMKIRIPKLIVMLITAFSIGGASLVFQSIINNTIVTPCLLGMNSLYTLIHTAVVFFLGSASVVASNANLSFAVDVVLMGITATIIYSWIFKKTKHNVLYVLLLCSSLACAPSLAILACGRLQLHSQWAYCQVRAFICILAKNLKEPAVSAAGSFDYFFASLALALARCLFISAMSASQTSSMSPTMP